MTVSRFATQSGAALPATTNARAATCVTTTVEDDGFVTVHPPLRDADLAAAHGIDPEQTLVEMQRAIEHGQKAARRAVRRREGIQEMIKRVAADRRFR